MNILQHILALLTRRPFIVAWRRPLPFIASPWQLAFVDTLLFIFYSPLLPLALWPYFGSDPSSELYFMNWRNVMALLLQLFLFFYAFVVIGFVAYASIFGCIGFLPPHGIVAIVVGAIIVAIAWYLATSPLQYTSHGGSEFPHESWFFVNGICTGQTWRKLNCEALAGMFGRKIVGINNRTFGIVLDVFESIIQRCFGYTTDEASQLYAIVQCELRDPTKLRVVLIAHSQVCVSLYSEVGLSMRRNVELWSYCS